MFKPIFMCQKKNQTLLDKASTKKDIVKAKDKAITENKV